MSSRGRIQWNATSASSISSATGPNDTPHAMRDAFAPSCGTQRKVQTAAYLVECVIPRVPVRQWVLSFPIPLRSLFAVHPELLAPVLQIIHRVITTLVIQQTGVKRKDAATGAITFIQRFGSAANLNIHLHALGLDGVYCTSGEGAPVFHQAPAPTHRQLQTLLDKIVKTARRTGAEAALASHPLSWGARVECEVTIQGGAGADAGYNSGREGLQSRSRTQRAGAHELGALAQAHVRNLYRALLAAAAGTVPFRTG